MVRVPVYEGRQVSARPDFQQPINIQASPSAFGADIGSGMIQLAKGADEAATSVGRLRDLQGKLAAKDSLTAFERDKMQLDYGPNGYMTTQGRNSVDGYEKYTADLEELKKKHGAGLTGVAAVAYNDAATSAVTSGMQSGIVHSAQGSKDWAASASTARLATIGDMALAAYAKPQEVQKQIAAGFMEIGAQADLMGWGKDVVDLKKREFASGVHTNVALAMASQPNGAGAALGYLTKNAGLIDTKTRMDIEAKLKPYADEEAALSVINDIMKTPREGAQSRTVAGSGPTAARADLMARAASAGKGADHVDGLTEDFATNLSAMFQDAPAGIREGLQVGSGFRSVDRQAQLFADAVKKYGSPEAARKWVAPPGNSQHNHGNAVDIWYKGQRLDKAPQEVQDWVHANADKYGLRFPMSYEPWHIEPTGARGGSTVVPSGAGVSARATMPSYDEAMSKIMAIEDPAVRAAAMTQFNAQIEMRSKAEGAASTAAKSEMWSMVAQGTPVSQIPLNLKIAAGREAVQGFMDYEGKAGEIKTDPILQRNLTLFAATDPVSFGKMDLTAPEIINALSAADMKSMTDKQAGVLNDQRKAREDGLQISSAMTFARTQLDAVGISTTGLDGTKRADMAKREAQFQMALADEMEAWARANDGRQPTQVDVQKMTNRLLLPIVIKTPGTIWDSNQDAFAFEAGKRADGTTVDVVVKYADIPIDLRRGIGLDLERELGRKPSEDEIVQRYEAFMLSR